MSVRYTQEEYDRVVKGGQSTAAMSERKFQAEVMKVAAQLGWRFYHTHDSIGSQAGFPDLVMVRDDRLIFAELKTEKGKLSHEQLEWITALGMTRATVCMWRPSMIDEIVQLLR